MNTPIETTPPAPAPPDSSQRRTLPRWAWVLIALLTVIALVATAVAVFAPRGRDVASRPAPSDTAPVPGSTLANGCVGGLADLDQAVLTAQKQAPLTAAGAAAFTATLIRWGEANPWPADHEATARQVLTSDATETTNPFQVGAEATVRSASFADGRFYVESLTRDTAIVSYLATDSESKNGVPQPDLTIAGTAHLVAVDRVWHLRDITAERSIADLQRIGLPYSGGC